MKWFNRILDAVVPTDAKVDTMVILNPDDDDEVGIDRNDVAHWIAIHIGNFFPDEFAKAAQHFGFPVSLPQSMTPVYAQAMISEINIRPKAAKVHKQFTKSHLGLNLPPSENKIKSLGVGHFPPTYLEFLHKNEGTQLLVQGD
jgi:hypothetical protein